MLFGCSKCCGCGCKDCAQGSLPESVTLTIDGFEDGVTPGRYLCPLAFSACYGSGAEARVTAPGGNAETDKGPITAVQVTKGGSGYAKIGRVAPTVTVSDVSGSGAGATFAVTLASSKDACNVDRWAVSKVVRTGGAGYQTGDALTFAIAEGDTQEVAATAKISDAIYAEPTLSLSVPGGSGAVLQIDGYTKSSDYWGWNNFSDTWRISGITVANGGTGYTNNTLVTVTLGQDDEARPGGGSDLRVRTGFRAPNDDWTLQDGNPAPTGTGLVLSLTLVAHPTAARTFWVNSWAITNGGTGYAVGQRIRPLANEGNNAASPLRANLEITAVDGNGAVTALALFGTTTFTQNQSRGRYSIETGVITSVENLFAQAGWRKAIANPDGVLVTDGGVYYREDTSVPAYVSPVTVTVTQSPPSAGSGASLSVEIDDEPASETFGRITGVNIDNGGGDYLAYEWCESLLQGLTVVLPLRGEGYQECLDYYKEDCGRSFRVDYRGWCLPPRVILTSPCSNYSLPHVPYFGPVAEFDLFASENIADCSDFSFTASDSAGRSVTVTPGGVPTEVSCSSCEGHVLINGVQVPLTQPNSTIGFNWYGAGLDNYTLVSVDPGPTISTQPIQGGSIPNWWRTYAVAQAVNFGCQTGWRQELEVWVRVLIWVFGAYNNGPFPAGGYVAGDYDQLTVGSVRASNPYFAPWNALLEAYEDRVLGPIRGSNCSGNEWHWVAGAERADISGYFTANSPRPPSFVVYSKDTRQSGRGNVQCGPI